MPRYWWLVPAVVGVALPLFWVLRMLVTPLYAVIGLGLFCYFGHWLWTWYMRRGEYAPQVEAEPWDEEEADAA